MTTNIHMDLNEGRTAELCCLECHHPEAFITMTSTYLVYTLDCDECGTEIVRWDTL